MTTDGGYGPTPTRIRREAHSQGNQQHTTKWLGGDILDGTVLIGALGRAANGNLGRNQSDDQVGETASSEAQSGHYLDCTAVLCRVRHG
jgi:hypothetical protein